MSVETVRSQPCIACPYRRDVPSGLWAASEYEKLPAYDAPTGSQPFEPFACHATPEHFCHGWAVVHSSRGHDRELMALRLHSIRTMTEVAIPEAGVPLFASGAEAAEHGLRDLTDPTPEAREAMTRLLRKYSRLEPGK